MNQKLGFLSFWGIHNSLPSFWTKLGYSWIKIDHIADSLLKHQIKIGVHLINVELSQLLTLGGATTLHTTRPLPPPLSDLPTALCRVGSSWSCTWVGYYLYTCHSNHDESEKCTSLNHKVIQIFNLNSLSQFNVRISIIALHDASNA